MLKKSRLFVQEKVAHSASVDWRVYFNLASAVLILTQNYQGCRHLSYSLSLWRCLYLVRHIKFYAKINNFNPHHPPPPPPTGRRTRQTSYCFNSLGWQTARIRIKQFTIWWCIRDSDSCFRLKCALRLFSHTLSLVQ